MSRGCHFTCVRNSRGNSLQFCKLSKSHIASLDYLQFQLACRPQLKQLSSFSRVGRDSYHTVMGRSPTNPSLVAEKLEYVLTYSTQLNFFNFKWVKIRVLTTIKLNASVSFFIFSSKQTTTTALTSESRDQALCAYSCGLFATRLHVKANPSSEEAEVFLALQYHILEETD